MIPEFYWPKNVLVDSTVIKIRNTPYTFGTRWLIKNNLYEKEERELLLQVLAPGMQVIEMGGSIGVLSAVIANAIDKEGRLVSIEASEKLTQYSKKWLEKMGNVRVVTGYGFPIWKAPALQLKKFDETAGSLGGTLSFDITTSAEAGKAHENIYDISRLCSQYDLQPDVLVIDVEGSEIIMTTQPILLPPSVRYLLIELHNGIYAQGKKDEALVNSAIVADGFILQQRLANVYLYTRGK